MIYKGDKRRSCRHEIAAKLNLLFVNRNTLLISQTKKMQRRYLLDSFNRDSSLPMKHQPNLATDQLTNQSLLSQPTMQTGLMR